MTEIRRFAISPPWWEDEAVADKVWRVVVSTLGPTCNELWLRFGHLEELSAFLSPAQYQRLEELIGPYWGQPDPMRATPAPGEVQSVLGSDFLQGLVDDLKQAGFVATGAQVPAPKYEPYGCAVVPLTQELLDLIAALTAVQGTPAEMLSRLADHWHFRSGERDLIGTGDGMAAMGLHLTEKEAVAVRSSLQAAGLDPSVLRDGRHT